MHNPSTTPSFCLFYWSAAGALVVLQESPGARLLDRRGRDQFVAPRLVRALQPVTTLEPLVSLLAVLVVVVAGSGLPQPTTP